MGNIKASEREKMQKKPKTGDLFDRGTEYNFELVPLKAHRNHQYATILGGLAIDYRHLVGGGSAFNGELGKRVKIWKVRGT